MNRQTYSRKDRLEAEFRAILTELLMREVNDPRLDGVVVSVVRLSADRTHAQVFYSVVGDDERERQAGDGFAAAAAFLRRELGKRMRLRTIPTLDYARDTSYEHGDRMERLFDKLHADGAISEAAPAAVDEEDDA